MGEEEELPLDAGVLDRIDGRHPQNHHDDRHKRPSGQNRKRQPPGHRLGEQRSRGHAQHVGHRLAHHHHGHGLCLLALVGKRFGDQRGRAEERAMRQAGNETRHQQHRRAEGDGAERVADQRDGHEQDDKMLRRHLAAEHQDQCADTHADGVCGDVMAGRGNADMHGGGRLGQDAHHHEFGGAEDEGAGGQRQNASLHGDSLFWIVRRTSTWMVPSVGSILRFPRNRR